MGNGEGHTDINPNDKLVHQAIDPIKPLPYPLPNGEWALNLSFHQALNRYMKTKGIGADISSVHFLPHIISLGPACSLDSSLLQNRSQSRHGGALTSGTSLSCIEEVASNPTKPANLLNVVLSSTPVRKVGDIPESTRICGLIPQNREIDFSKWVLEDMDWHYSV
jgi:hypothetical protein